MEPAPTPRNRTGKQVNVLLPHPASEALARFAAARGERPTQTVRRIVLDALLISGQLSDDPEPYRRSVTSV